MLAKVMQLAPEQKVLKSKVMALHSLQNNNIFLCIFVVFQYKYLNILIHLLETQNEHEVSEKLNKIKFLLQTKTNI